MSNRWLERQQRDIYVKRAQAEGYRARAAFKLLELNDKDHFLKSGMSVIDLGAAPGSWSQVASKLVGPKGKVIALDILPMDALPNVEFIQGDFNDDAVYQKLVQAVSDAKVDVVLSDMAPNLSGQVVIDQPRVMQLTELAWDFAQQHLKPGGSFVCKLFQGPDVDQFGRMIKMVMDTVKWRKPQSSRKASREIYLVALGFKNP